VIPRSFRYVLVVAACLVASAAADTNKLPTLNEVLTIAQRRFATLPDYRPGDLISRSQVQPIFEDLKGAGWIVRDQAQILALVPSDDEWFVRQLRSASGRTFVRQSARFPLSYDRIDRLSNMLMGHQNVKALMAGPDGYKMILYMTTTPYGRNMGQMLSQAPYGADFNSPTGRLYTAEAFLNRLAESYAAAVQIDQPTATVGHE